jgi:hydrogenase nickel incorporation protein HypA/HybF
MIRVVDHAMKAHEGARLRRVFVDVGRGSTVEPSLLREAFGVIVSGGPYDGVELVINDIPLSGRCKACGRSFQYQEIALGCRFSDCRHLTEPACAVKAAWRADECPIGFRKGSSSCNPDASWIRDAQPLQASARPGKGPVSEV